MSEPNDMGDCIIWTGRLDDSGYPRLGGALVHRRLFEARHGPIPAGFEIDHVCHSRDEACPGGVPCPHRRCVNVAHYELVTRRENTLRGRSFAGLNARKVRCDNGHPFSNANTYIRPDGGRACRACNREQVRLYRNRRKAAL